MTWFRLDDQWAHHPKVRAAGRDGRALWVAAGAACAAVNSDGIVEALVVRDAAYLAEVSAKKATALLVECGLWHDAGTLASCRRCKDAYSKLPAGAFLFHDWAEYQLTKDQAKVPIERLRWNRRKALLRDRELCNAIVRRDRSRCRYCGQRVDFKDRKGPLSGTYDHVDPDDFSPTGNSFGNVVVACRKCNGDKKDRTPAEAGMALLPEPAPDLAPARSGSDPARSESDRDQTGSGLHARVAREGGRVGTGPGRDQTGIRPRSDHSLTPSGSGLAAFLSSASPTSPTQEVTDVR